MVCVYIYIFIFIFSLLCFLCASFVFGCSAAVVEVVLAPIGGIGSIALGYGCLCSLWVVLVLE